MKRLILALGAAATLALAGGGVANATTPAPHIRPNVITQVCDNMGNGHCLQAAGSGSTVHAFAPNGQPNQEFNFFLPSTPSCGDNISDTNCPFPGVTPGQQIVVIGGQSAQNAGSCGGWGSVGNSGTLRPCNGGTGIVMVLDGFAVESGLIGRQQGHKTYLCEGGGNGVAVFNSFTSGACQWTNA